MKFSGYEGFFGTIYLGAVVIILGLIPCSDDADSNLKCTAGIFVNSWESLKIIIHSTTIILLYLGFMLTGSAMKISSVYLVKSTSATSWMTIDSVWIVFVWIFFLSYPSEYFEHESFNTLQFIGFLCLISGTILFNEIFTLPFWGFDQYTKEKL